MSQPNQPMPAEDVAQWLTTSDAATVLDVAEETVRRRIRRGELQARKVPGATGGFIWEIATDQNGQPIEFELVDGQTDSPTDRIPIIPTGHPHGQTDGPMAHVDSPTGQRPTRRAR